MVQSKKNVVVVGGGFAGSAIARSLSAKLDPSKHSLTLVNNRPFAIHNLGGARMTVSDHDRLEDIALIPYDKVFINQNGSLIVGRVTAIDKNGGEKGGIITLKSGETIPYDVLVLAPGSAWSSALAFPDGGDEVVNFIRQWRSKYEKAKHIVLAGGGAVGIETAGEIKDAFPDKKVTIVQGDNLLTNKTYPDKFRKALDTSLRARGVEIVYNDFIDDIPADGVVGVTTRNGKQLDADLVVSTKGPRPNTAFIATLGSDTITDRGFVKVKPTLQLLSHSDIYAAGDVIDWAEQKQAAKTQGHAAVVTANILSDLAGEKPVKEYKGAYELIVITNGKGGGVAYFDVLWGLMFGNWLARFVKSKDLLVPMFRKSLGQS
jgi:NADH dehydrogenase FAD-containing subunit